MKTLNEVIIDRLNYYMGKMNISQYQLAEMSGVPYPTLKSIMQRRTRGITLKTIVMLAHGLQTTLNEFLSSEAFLYENLLLE